jgi:hypothetical protein
MSRPKFELNTSKTRVQRIMMMIIIIIIIIIIIPTPSVRELVTFCYTTEFDSLHFLKSAALTMRHPFIRKSWH